jgi:hypothetical protein
VSVSAPGVSTKLNQALPAGTVGVSVASYSATDAYVYVVFNADGNTANTRELFRVGVASPGVATRLNSTLVTDGEVYNFVNMEGRATSTP